MADTKLAVPTAAERSPSRPSLMVRYRLTPWWVKVIVIFLASRVVTTIILLAFASIQGINPWGGAHPDYLQFAAIWDGNWYKIIAIDGYPPKLMLDAQGHVDENAWAFLPAYPFICRGIMALTGLSFNVVGLFVTVAFALAAALVFYKLLEPRLGSSTALFSVVLFCFAPLSPILQVDYAESMQLLFLAVALLYLQRRQYWMMLPFVIFMSFTKPSGLAFALALGIHIIYRWVVRARDPFPPAQIAAAIVAAAVSAVAGSAWPVIAGVATGMPDAYTATELAWRSSYVGWGALVPFQPWIQGVLWWSNWIGVHNPLLDYAALIVFVALFVVLLFTRPMKRIGADLRIWTASWGIYLLAVFFPQSSVFRLFMPMFPVLGALAQPKALAYRIGIVLLMIAGQIGWVYIDYWVNGYDWTPP